jgi:superfamily II DNA or RNA helicase
VKNDYISFEFVKNDYLYGLTATPKRKNNDQKLIFVYTGRIQRSESPPVIFDYRDKKIDHFEKMFKQRNRYYKKLL